METPFVDYLRTHSSPQEINRLYGNLSPFEVRTMLECYNYLLNDVKVRVKDVFRDDLEKFSEYYRLILSKYL